MTHVTPTAEFASLVYGDGVALDDPAEALHEASRLYPNVAPGRLGTLLALGRSPELQQTALRASRARPHLPGVALPDQPLPRTRLRDVVRRRMSGVADVRRPLRLRDLAMVLGASCRSADRAPGAPRRPVPSGGALYPLELYVVALAVNGLAPAAFHYDPFRHRLALLGPIARGDVAAAAVDPTLVERSSALLVVTAMFWRTRFKYGVRGYRFALLEAGHLVQNAILAATALRLPALPLGGFYDRRVDALVGCDGLDESTVHALLLGGRP